MAAMLTGNMDDGFAEALIRGFKTTFLSDTEYQNMMECESVEDLVLIFQETDYGNFLAKEDDPSAAPDWRDVEPRARAKAAEEFLWVRSHAVEPLATFMDFVTHEYMIELVLELLKLSSSRSPEQSDEEFIADVERTLHVTSHPLGRFDESTAKAITAFGTKELDELCSTVLVETPVGRYFEQYLANEAQSSVLRGSEVAAQISETPIARLEHGVMKIWMEDFRAFAVSLGGETAEVMEELLGARAAAATINITYNSMNTEFGTGAVREEFRRSCFPAFGPLYPEIARELYKVSSPTDMERVLRLSPSFFSLWRRAALNPRGEKQLFSVFAKKDIFLLQRAFLGQFHYGIFYAYMKLKELEAKNLGWIAKQVKFKTRDFARIIVPFSDLAPLGPAVTGDAEEVGGGAD